MSNEIRSLYEEIRLNLENSRKALIATTILGDETSPGIRSLEEAELVLNVLEFIAVETRALLDLYPSLESLFEKNFGRVVEVFEREAVLETCLLEDYIFPVTSSFPMLVEGNFSQELTD